MSKNIYQFKYDESYNYYIVEIYSDIFNQLIDDIDLVLEKINNLFENISIVKENLLLYSVLGKTPIIKENLLIYIFKIYTLMIDIDISFEQADFYRIYDPIIMDYAIDNIENALNSIDEILLNI